jgi:predicted Holliday junction resolvase-like endonuclease
MSPDLKTAGSNKTISVVLVILLLISLAVTAGLSLSVNGLKGKIKQQEAVIKEKDRQLEADKVQYTSLAARLHKEIKKAGALEEELQKYKRR